MPVQLAAKSIAHFDWAVYGYSSGHFISLIWSLGLPFNITLSATPLSMDALSSRNSPPPHLPFYLGHLHSFTTCGLLASHQFSWATSSIPKGILKPSQPVFFGKYRLRSSRSYALPDHSPSSWPSCTQNMTVAHTR
jgi:hypothetical protein